MVERKLPFGIAFVTVGLITMLLGKMFAKTWGDLFRGSVFGAFLIGIGVAVLGVWLADRVKKGSILGA